MWVSDIQQVIAGLIGQSGKNAKELVPGSVITALLKEIKGNMALLNYLGTDFLARLETDAPVGERLRFFVEGKKEGQTVLKLLGNEKESNNVLLSGIVKDLGLSDEPANSMIVREMLRQKMPLDPGVAGRLSTFIRSLEISEQNVWVPVFMQNNNLTLSPENYRHVSALLNDIHYLHQDITKLSDAIAKVFPTVDSKGELGQLIASVSSLLSQFKLKPEEGSLNTILKLATIFRNFMHAGPNAAGLQGMQFSPEVPVSPELPVTPSVSVTSKVSVAPEVSITPEVPVFKAQFSPEVPLSRSSPVFSSLSDLTDAPASNSISESSVVNKENLVSKGQALEIPVPQSPAAFHDNEGRVANERILNLDSLLNKLSIILRDNTEPEHRELLRLLQDFGDKLDFIRNFNSNTELNRENMMVMYSSVKFDENESPFRLLVKYRQENREKARNFTSCRMEIRLNTPGLGLVKCEVQVVEKSLTIQFVGAGETIGFIDRFTGILVNRLSELKFNVNLLPTRALAEQENDFLSCEADEIPGLFQLNLKI